MANGKPTTTPGNSGNTPGNSGNTPGNSGNTGPPITPPGLAKKPKPYKVYTVRVYATDGAYGGEMIDEFEYKASHFKSFAGQYIREAENELQNLIEGIGKNGYTITTPSGGKLYYPPHRIYYVEAEEIKD
jgi:hypothetical protein